MILLQAVIFVVDCAAPEKLSEAADAVAEVMSIGTLSGLPLVVFCNKCDRRRQGDDETETETLSLEEIEAALSPRRKNLGTLMGVFDTSSFESEGIQVALDSLVQKGAKIDDAHKFSPPLDGILCSLTMTSYLAYFETPPVRTSQME